MTEADSVFSYVTDMAAVAAERRLQELFHGGDAKGYNGGAQEACAHASRTVLW